MFQDGKLYVRHPLPFQRHYPLGAAVVVPSRYGPIGGTLVEIRKPDDDAGGLLLIIAEPRFLKPPEVGDDEQST